MGITVEFTFSFILFDAVKHEECDRGWPRLGGSDACPLLYDWKLISSRYLDVAPEDNR